MANSGVHEEEYSAGSDHDSIYHADSPSDGYFGTRDHPRETFVENSSIQAESETKAREAAESLASTSAVGSPPTQTSPTLSTGSPTWADEQAPPILDAGPAPPDYAAATANRLRTQGISTGQDEDLSTAAPRQSNLRAYGSIEQHTSERESSSELSERQWPFGSRGNPFGPEYSNRQWPFGNRGNPFGPDFPFGPKGNPLGVENPSFDHYASAHWPNQPQSMRDESGAPQQDIEDEESSLITRQPRKKPRWRWMNFRSCCTATSVLNVVLAIVIVALILFLVRVTQQGRDTSAPAHGGLDSPIDGGNDGDGNLTTPRPAHCVHTSCSDVMTFSFRAPSNFSFTQTMEHVNYFSGNVLGSVNILAAPVDQDSAVEVLVTYATTEPWVVTSLDWFKSEDGLQLKVREDDRGYAAKPCLDLNVDIYVRSEVVIDAWDIATVNLDIRSTKGSFKRAEGEGPASNGLAKTSSISTISGDVDMEFWSSRETTIETTSGSVRGFYALYDKLSIRTQSGSIGVRVQPKEALESHPSPAEFNAISRSGKVHAGFSMDGFIPKRDYRTRVESYSGSISGGYVLGSSAAFTSYSGSIGVDVLPYDTITKSSLVSDTHSGSTNLYVMSPYRANSTALGHMTSSHKSDSGRLDLGYPQEWEGSIDGETISGKLDVTGRDVQCYYIDDTARVRERHFIGRKGYGASKLGFKTKSGSIDLKVGDS